MNTLLPTPKQIPEIPIEKAPSSALVGYGYDERLQILAVEFANGKVFHYLEFPPEKYYAMKTAASVGSFFVVYVKRIHACYLAQSTNIIIDAFQRAARITISTPRAFMPPSILALALLLAGCAQSTAPTSPREQKPRYQECGFTHDGLRDSCWPSIAARSSKELYQ